MIAFQKGSKLQFKSILGTNSIVSETLDTNPRNFTSSSSVSGECQSKLQIRSFSFSPDN